jgi:hypothetical protein
MTAFYNVSSSRILCYKINCIVRGNEQSTKSDISTETQRASYNEIISLKLPIGYKWDLK